MNINNLTPTTRVTHDYTAEVLIPLHQAQAAKAEADRVASEQAAKVVAAQAQQARELEAKRVVQASPVSSGNCAEWLAAAGVTDTVNAMYIINRESGCNPWAVNASGGACGVAQELPCGKSGCRLGDGACQVKWMNGYVGARYGGWSGAVAWWDGHSWY
jgi:hypothetical protein